MWVAAQERRVDDLTALLSWCSSFHTASEDHSSTCELFTLALRVAACNDHAEAMLALLDARPNVNPTLGVTPLWLQRSSRASARQSVRIGGFPW